MSAESTNQRAQSFKALHVAGQPLVLINVHDKFSAKVVSSIPQIKALATASAAIALANGREDTNLDLETQLEAIKEIAEIAHAAKKPLTVDLQDGYGDRLEEAISEIIRLGVVGINLEDSVSTTETMMDEQTAIDRIKRVLKAASEAGVPDFVINARSDTFMLHGDLDAAIRKAKLYLDAGATTVYILGGGDNGLSKEQVRKIVDELHGRVNIFVKNGSKTLTVKDLIEMGAVRISTGPELYFAMIKAVQETVAAIIDN